MAMTVLVNPYTKEGVESLRILPYTSVNVHVVNSQQLKFNAVHGQSPENQCGQWSKHQKELVKVLTCGPSHDYRVYGSDALYYVLNCFVQTPQLFFYTFTALQCHPYISLHFEVLLHLFM